MKMKKSSSLLLVIAFAFILGSCKKDDVDTVILQSKVYQLSAMAGSNITGTATFTEDSDGKTHVLIELDGSNTSEHPAFIRYNSASEGGPIAITLEACTCSISDTVVSELDGGASINYDGLLKLDGHISIHESTEEIETIISVANIGVNE